MNAAEMAAQAAAKIEASEGMTAACDAGEALLDADPVFCRWWEPGIVDLSRLDMHSPADCLVGQVAAALLGPITFDVAPWRAGIRHLRLHAPPSYGFDMARERDWTYAELDAEWRRRIEERRRADEGRRPA